MEPIDKLIERLKELDKKRTQGEWCTNYTGNIWADENDPECDGDPELLMQIFKGDFEPQKSAELDEWQCANRDFIVACSKTVPHLITEIETLRKKVEQLSKWKSDREKLDNLIAEQRKDLKGIRRG